MVERDEQGATEPSPVISAKWKAGSNLDTIFNLSFNLFLS